MSENTMTWEEICSDIEVWLAVKPQGSGSTQEEILEYHFAESGMDREVGFDLETEQYKAYNVWLDRYGV